MVNDILCRLRSVLPNTDTQIVLHEPDFDGSECVFIKECLDRRWVSSVGGFVERFEADLALYTGVKHVIATVNGTAALHICLLVAGVEPGDEVLVPALTFVATANAVSYCGGIPHLVDCSEETLGMDPTKLESYLQDVAEIRPDGCWNRMSGRRVKALVPIHTFGHPVDLDPLAELCRRYKLQLIEDAAEALGSFYKGRHTGNWGKLSALSFNGNKIVTTGGGGAILTNDDELARMARHLTTVAKLPHPWKFVHDQIGYNYRMPNLNAALGIAQLQRLPDLLRLKRELASAYHKAFDGAQGYRCFKEPPFARSNYWLNALILDESFADCFDELLERTNREGIMTRPFWTPLHQLEMYKHCPRMDLSVAESLAVRTVNLPSSSFLGGYHGEGQDLCGHR
ncbi:LegC family aminotransferase [Alicyclobacillus macrosporangiidus]|nr:LegC family aminotransferase [Alicyclobacillus macrosporangiidus]